MWLEHIIQVLLVEDEKNPNNANLDLGTGPGNLMHTGQSAAFSARVTNSS